MAIGIMATDLINIGEVSMLLPKYNNFGDIKFHTLRIMQQQTLSSNSAK
jgi:hypothetical protein